MPFTAVATDLLARKEVWFQRGPVEVALRASIALPSFITPVMLNGRLLADGGMMNPIPIAPLSALQSDATVAVTLAGDPDDQSGRTPVHASAEPRPTGEWLERLRRNAGQILGSERGPPHLRPVRRRARRGGLSHRGGAGRGALRLCPRASGSST